MGDEETVIELDMACDDVRMAVVESANSGRFDRFTDYATEANACLRKLEVACQDAPESLAEQAIRRAVVDLLDADIGAEYDNNDFARVLRQSRYAPEPKP